MFRSSFRACFPRVEPQGRGWTPWRSAPPSLVRVSVHVCTNIYPIRHVGLLSSDDRTGPRFAWTVQLVEREILHQTKSSSFTVRNNYSRFAFPPRGAADGPGVQRRSSELDMSLRWTFSRCCCWCRRQFVSCSLRIGSPARITGPFASEPSAAVGWL